MDFRPNEGRRVDTVRYTPDGGAVLVLSGRWEDASVDRAALLSARDLNLIRAYQDFCTPLSADNNSHPLFDGGLLYRECDTLAFRVAGTDSPALRSNAALLDQRVRRAGGESRSTATNGIQYNRPARLACLHLASDEVLIWSTDDLRILAQFRPRTRARFLSNVICFGNSADPMVAAAYLDPGEAGTASNQARKAIIGITGRESFSEPLRLHGFRLVGSDEGLWLIGSDARPPQGLTQVAYVSLSRPGIRQTIPGSAHPDKRYELIGEARGWLVLGLFDPRPRIRNDADLGPYEVWAFPRDGSPARRLAVVGQEGQFIGVEVDPRGSTLIRVAEEGVRRVPIDLEQ